MTAAAAAHGALTGPPVDLRGDSADPEPGSSGSPESSGSSGSSGSPPPRVICVGLGSGALPAFIARVAPRCAVEIVEIDPVVVEAASEHHGVSTPEAEDRGVSTRGGDAGTPRSDAGSLDVVVGDAGEFMASARRRR